MKKLIFKIGKILHSIGDMYKDKLAQIVFMALLLMAFIFIRQLPYINIISGYPYYVVAVYLFLIIVFFRKHLPNRRLFLIIEIVVVTTLVVELLFMKVATDFLGFIVFTLLAVVAIFDFLSQRRKLKEY